METITSWSRLHPSLKLLITSRDHRITPSLRQVCYHIPLETGALVDCQANVDIQTFFEQRFAEIASDYPSLQSWPGPSVIKHLTDRAAGLFIWADTVIRFLEQGLPKEQLNLILSEEFREEGDVIDQLYLKILKISFNNNAKVITVFKRVVGVIVMAKTPLSRADLGYFLGQQDGEESIDFILSHLSSVISNCNSDGRIHISHLSFTEFICDPKRCQEDFAIDRSVQSRIMTLACLQVMEASLRFNICELETSHLRNDDFDLMPRIQKFIPTHLSYACSFWAEHLRVTMVDTQLLCAVKDFMETRLLFWLEVLSLVKKINIASKALQLAYEWSAVSTCFYHMMAFRELFLFAFLDGR